MRNLLLVVFFAGLNGLSVFAQNNSTAESSAAPNSSSINWENFELEMTEIDADWTIHTNMEQKTVYIDFKALGGNMSKLALINKANMETVIMDDRLYDLPSNTIYEISLAKLTKGSYSLELHTYNSVIKEEINIQ
jgi:hypothetical protein